MKKIQLGTSDQKVAAVILGCMRINNAEDPVKVIETAYENGIDFLTMQIFMGNGECEEIFADALAKQKHQSNEKIFLFKQNVESFQV